MRLLLPSLLALLSLLRGSDAGPVVTSAQENHEYATRLLHIHEDPLRSQESFVKAHVGWHRPDSPLPAGLSDWRSLAIGSFHGDEWVVLGFGEEEVGLDCAKKATRAVRAVVAASTHPTAEIGEQIHPGVAWLCDVAELDTGLRTSSSSSLWTRCLEAHVATNASLCGQPPDARPASNLPVSHVYDRLPLQAPEGTVESFLMEGGGDDDTPVIWMEMEAEANAWARGIPMLGEILNPVINEAMTPIINPVVNMMAPALGEDFQEMFHQEMSQQLPGDVSEMLSVVLSANLTNVVGDALSSRLTRTLAAGLTKILGPRLLQALPAKVARGAVASATDVAMQSLAERVARRIGPRIRERVLPQLVRSLTVSVTQAAVPSIVAGLVESPSGSMPAGTLRLPLSLEWCRLCNASQALAKQGLEPPAALCGWCSASVEEQERSPPPPALDQIWAAHYYAAWYAEAMSKYFSDAAVAARDQQHTVRMDKEREALDQRMERLRTALREGQR